MQVCISYCLSINIAKILFFNMRMFKSYYIPVLQPLRAVSSGKGLVGFIYMCVCVYACISIHSAQKCDEYNLSFVQYASLI